jgi:O-antigen ligase
MGLLFSFSRGAWVGMVVGLAVLALNLRQARRILFAVGLSVVPVATLMGAFAPDAPQIGVVGERLSSIVGQKSPYEYRPQIWAEARREIESRPLVGDGPGNFPVASQRSTAQAESTFFADHAHNFLLTWAAEAGLPAMALLIGLTVHVTVLVRRARRHAVFEGRHRDVALLAGLTAAFTALMTQGLVDYPLRHSVVFIALLGLLGFLLAGCRAELTDRAAAPAQVLTGSEA